MELMTVTELPPAAIASTDVDALEGRSRKEIAMHKAGASREASYKAMADGLKARKVTVQKDGSTIDEPDHQVRLKAAEMIARMNGDIKPEVMVDNRSVSISMAGVSADVLKGLVGMVADVREQIAGLRGSGRQTGEVIDTVSTEVASG